MVIRTYIYDNMHIIYDEYHKQQPITAYKGSNDSLVDIVRRRTEGA